MIIGNYPAKSGCVSVYRYKKMVIVLANGEPFPASLHIHQMTDKPGIYEMRWSDRGRATFHYGPEVAGEHPIIWRRIGGHEIYAAP